MTSLKWSRPWEPASTRELVFPAGDPAQELLNIALGSDSGDASLETRPWLGCIASQTIAQRSQAPEVSFTQIVSVTGSQRPRPCRR